MNKEKRKILFLVEGEYLEKEVFSEMANLYNLKYEIVCLRCNIFMLYNIMKSYDFNASIKDILIERIDKNINDDEAIVLKNNKFAYTYLIMDFDIQHFKNDIPKALKQINEMCSYFSNETDDTIGKLYINYPMMESFRDRNGFIDDSFIEKTIKLEEFVNYKMLVGNTGLSSIHINEYRKDGFNSIIKSNIVKALLKLFDVNEISYKKYVEYLTTLSIYVKQKEILHNDYIYVLNTSMNFVVDYYGEKFFNILFGL